jgi:hypothetical protein
MLEIPPNFRPLDALGKKHEGLVEARQAAATELRRLDGELKDAAENDRKAFADRLAKDVTATDPGGKQEAKTREKIAAAKARYDALVTAVAVAEREISETTERNRSKWLADAEANAEKARKAYARTVDAVDIARGEYDEARGLVAWLNGQSLRKAMTTPPIAALALKRPSGELASFEAVAAGLREDALRPEQRAPHTLARLAEVEHAA